jgi:hypothetical protein
MARSRRRPKPEFSLNIFQGTDPKTRRQGWIFLVQTVKEFVSFNYEIVLSATVEKNAITLHISGIHAPLMVMPGLGPAKGWVLIDDIVGSYTLTVRKLNKEVNDFRIVIGSDGLEVHGKSQQPFVTIGTEPLPLD